MTPHSRLLSSLSIFPSIGFLHSYLLHHTLSFLCSGFTLPMVSSSCVLPSRSPLLVFLLYFPNFKTSFAVEFTFPLLSHI